MWTNAMDVTAAEKMVIEVLRSKGPCLLDDLIKSTPALTRGQLLAAVDQLSIDGRVILNQVEYTYQLLPSILLIPPSRRMPSVMVGLQNIAADLAGSSQRGSRPSDKAVLQMARTSHLLPNGGELSPGSASRR